MTAWTGRHFSRPYLDADVELGSGSGEIALVRGGRRGTLAVDGDIDSAHALLVALTNPDCPAWTAARGGDAAPLQVLLRDLDRLGWLREADDGAGRDLLAARTAALATTVEWAHAWLANAGRAREPATANLADATLRQCRTSWRNSSPLTDAILNEVLDGGNRACSLWDPVALAVCDPAEIAQQVWAAVQLSVLRGIPGLAARHREFLPWEVDGTGVNVLVRAEAAAEALLGALAPLELTGLIERPGGATAAAPVVFQHRWFATIRYVDAAAGMLTYRLAPALRRLAVSYIGEEMGHEVHEAATCRRLGVDDEALATFAPLVWFAAYPEVLSSYAQRTPLSFLLSMTVAEGLPGSGQRLSERLLERGFDVPGGADHDAIDRELNHEMVTRTMLAQLPWIDADTARRAIADFLHVVEISHFGWQMLSRYVDAGLPATPVPFGLPAETVVGLNTAS